jgi:hypothetical protein
MADDIFLFLFACSLALIIWHLLFLSHLPFDSFSRDMIMVRMLIAVGFSVFVLAMLAKIVLLFSQ